MNKKIFYILIYSLFSTILRANNEADLVLKSNSDIFQNYYIPTKYKKESAIILAQEFHFVAQNSTQYLWVKQKILLNDWDGVDYFSQIYFPKDYKEDSILITKKNGGKINLNFKPNENNQYFNPPSYFNLYERNKYWEYQKMKLENLVVGDIIEFSYKIIVDYKKPKSFNFSIGSLFPIINRTISVLHQDNFIVNARYTSPDIKFKTYKKSSNQQINTIEFFNLDKSLEEFAIPINIVNPSVLLEIVENKTPKYTQLTSDKIGAINEMADMEQIKQNVHQRILANTKILELKNKVLYFATIAKFGDIREVDNKRKVAAAFYIFRDQVFNQKKLPELDVDLFFYYWLKVCKANRWKYQIGFTFPKSYLIATQILSMEDVHYFIEIEGLRIFPNLKNPHQELKFVPLEVQGSTCYSTNFSKKFTKLKWLNSSIPVLSDNKLSVVKKINVDLSNNSLFVRDSVFALNYAKLIYQNEIFKDMNFGKTDYKHAGIRPVYNYTPKSAEELSAEKKAEKLHLDSVYKNHGLFLQNNGLEVDSLWYFNIKEDGRSEKYEKRIHVTEYKTKPLQYNNNNLWVSITQLLGNEILCLNQNYKPELGNFAFNYDKIYTIHLSAPSGYQWSISNTNLEINNSNFLHSLSSEIVKNELIINIHLQVKNYNYPLKNWKDHLDYCIQAQNIGNQKIILKKL